MFKINVGSTDFLAQAAHIGWGMALVFILALALMPTAAAVALVAAFAFGKEYIEYKWGMWEPRTSWRDSLRDFIFWSVGIAIALTVLLIR